MDKSKMSHPDFGTIYVERKGTKVRLVFTGKTKEIAKDMMEKIEWNLEQGHLEIIIIKP